MKYKSITILLFFMLLLLNFSSFSQEKKQKVASNRHGLGLNTGMTTGAGFSYRFMGEKIGFQASFIPVYTLKEKLYLIQGVSFNYNIKSENKFDLFTYIGSGLVFSKKEVSYSSVETIVNGSPVWANDHSIYKRYLFTTGGGLGINIKSSKYIDWVVRFGGMFFSDFRNTYGFIPSLGFGAYYAF